MPRCLVVLIFLASSAFGQTLLATVPMADYPQAISAGCGRGESLHKQGLRRELLRQHGNDLRREHHHHEHDKCRRRAVGLRR
jgi:hypothetical protein